MKLKKLAIALAGTCALATATIMPAAKAGSVELFSTTISGVEWKVKLKNGSTLRLNKDGNVKCSYSLIEYSDYMTCVTTKIGSTYYDDVWSAIKSKI
tara:strand:- start:4540 stop:4830 length:291 start_codon:yes stop_codon:yes gene_type:complete